MPNYDGIIWQNPTVMESLAPIISDVTKRMEDTIKDKAKQDLALQVKNQEMAYKKKIADEKARQANLKKQAKLPTSVPPVMFSEEAEILNAGRKDFMTRLGAANIELGDPSPEGIAFMGEWNLLQQRENEAHDRYTNYNQMYEKSGGVIRDEYERDPEEYIAEQRVSNQELIESLKGQNLSWKEIYDQAGDFGGFKLPNKKQKPVELMSFNDFKAQLPKRIVTQQTRNVTDEKGASKIRVKEIEPEDWVDIIRVNYDSDPEVRKIYDKNVPLNPDGTPNYKAIAAWALPYAQKEEKTDSETDKEAREKTNIVINTGERGRSKTSKKSRKEGVEYNPTGVLTNQSVYEGTDVTSGFTPTAFYETNDESLPSELADIPIRKYNGVSIHTLDINGNPINTKGAEIKKVNDNVRWFPLNSKGAIYRKEGVGVSGIDVGIDAVVPFAQYRDIGGNLYYVPISSVDKGYEIIKPEDARNDALEYANKQWENDTKRVEQKSGKVNTKDKTFE